MDAISEERIDKRVIKHVYQGKQFSFLFNASVPRYKTYKICFVDRVHTKYTIKCVLSDSLGGISYQKKKEYTVRPLLSGHPRDFEKWPLNRGTIKIG